MERSAAASTAPRRAGVVANLWRRRIRRTLGVGVGVRVLRVRVGVVVRLRVGVRM